MVRQKIDGVTEGAVPFRWRDERKERRKNLAGHGRQVRAAASASSIALRRTLEKIT